MEFLLDENKMKELGVAAVFLFGSQAQGVARENSDFDFAILLSRPMQPKEKSIVYDAIYDMLAPQIGRLATLDLVFIEDADLQFRFHVARDGKLLFTNDMTAVGNFLEKTVEEYADFAPYRRQFHAAILARV